MGVGIGVGVGIGGGDWGGVGSGLFTGDGSVTIVVLRDELRQHVSPSSDDVHC